MSPATGQHEAERRRLWKMAGMGMELAGATIGLGALGWWIDSKLGSEPWAMVAGGCLGITGGMFLFIKEALAAQRQSLRKPSKTPDRQDPPT